MWENLFQNGNFKHKMENPGIDPGTSRMQSERSTMWANSPTRYVQGIYTIKMTFKSNADKCTRFS